MIVAPIAEREVSRRLLELDGLRGLAAMLVLLYHYTSPLIEGRRIGESSWRVGWGGLGVQLFFMISGYVILMTAERVRSPRQFAIARASRLYPAYWAACLLAGSAYAVSGWPPQVGKLGTFAANLTMMQAFGGVEHLLSVFWTLHVELSFYLLVAVLLLLRGLRFMPHVLAVLVGAWLLTARAAGVNEFAFGASPPWLSSARMWFPLLFHHLHPMPFFLIGVVLYRVSRAGMQSVDVAALLVALADIGLHTRAHRPHLEAAILGLMIVMMIVATQSGARPLRLPALVFLGEISYAIYLMHVIVGAQMMAPMAAAGWDRNISIAIGILVTIALATMSTFGLERPVVWLLRPPRPVGS
ncbi:MAG: acyltransferase [Acidobacteria bacterium]|nr:acyltransferase [Acidobacteriota bacterium]